MDTFVPAAIYKSFTSMNYSSSYHVVLVQLCTLQETGRGNCQEYVEDSLSLETEWSVGSCIEDVEDKGKMVRRLRKKG